METYQLISAAVLSKSNHVNSRCLGLPLDHLHLIISIFTYKNCIILERMGEEAFALAPIIGLKLPVIKMKRSLPGILDPEAESVTLSPYLQNNFMDTYRFLCEKCGKSSKGIKIFNCIQGPRG